MKATRIILFLFLLALLMPLFGQGVRVLHKKETKTVRSHFGETATIEQVQIPDNKESLNEFMYPGDCLYNVIVADEVQAYLFSTQAKGRYDYFDYSIIFSKALSVQAVIITVYRSTHGAAICQKKWLSQFNGYNGGELKLGLDIDAVSGGTLSASSIVEDIRRCHLFMSAFLITD
jgi:hypothetical protein